MSNIFITKEGKVTYQFSPQEIDEFKLKRDSDSQERYGGSVKQRISSVAQEPTDTRPRGSRRTNTPL